MTSLQNVEMKETAQPAASNIAIDKVTPKPFGAYRSDKYATISDSLQLDIYSSSNLFLESILRVTNYSINGTKLSLDIEAELKNAQYLAGEFNITTKLLRNVLGSSDGHKLIIQDISSDRLEVRVRPTQLSTANPSETDSILTLNNSFADWFARGFFSLDKQDILTNLQLYTSPTEQIGVFDYVQDRITYENEPWSIIFKLTAPLPITTTVDSLVWFAQEVATPITDSVKVIPPPKKKKQTRIQGPNWDALQDVHLTKSTEYKDWDDLLGTTNQSQLVNNIFSGSFLEGVELNIDHTRFENFVHFGSATERIKNFEYKVKLIEYYDGIISDLTTGLSGVGGSSVTSSYVFTSQSAAYNQKKQALLGTFDPFERYMYYESSSYTTSSFGEFLDIAWPKSNNTKPYTLLSSSDPYIETWREGIIASASLYDQQNDNALVKLIPAHIRETDGNASTETLVYMFGHYFDIVYSYIKQLNSVYDRQEKLNEGFAKDLVYHIAQNLGVDFQNGSGLEDLWNYTLGLNANGTNHSSLNITSEDRTKEIWKRIINNLPFLLKTKGTERSIRALINCFGIPQTVLRIREYGGPEPEFDTATNAQFERFYYALKVGTSGSYGLSSYGTGSYGTASYTYPRTGASRLTTTWDYNANAIELRFKPQQNYKSQQTLFEIPGNLKVVINAGGVDSKISLYAYNTVGTTATTASISSSLYDGEFTHLVLNHVTNSISETDYTLYAKKTKYGKVTQTASASIHLGVAYLTSWIPTGSGFTNNFWLPGSGSNGLFSGSVQELRFWQKPLEQIVIDNHALAPTSFQGNTDDVFTGSTSSFDELMFRLALGSDNKKINYQVSSSYLSQHPNQTTVKSASFFDFEYSGSVGYEAIVEQNYLEWPDSGGNRQVANKIRIDNTTSTSLQLFRDNKTQRAASDTAPIDSPRLGVFLSPTNEVNQDIAEQFGGLSIDDYIGNPADTYNISYDALEDLRRVYLRKYASRNKAQSYINLLRYYDNSLFTLIKNFVPYRANLQTGLVIESDMLHRNKFGMAAPSSQEMQYSSSLATDVYTIGGSIEDAHTDYTPLTDYVKEGSINQPYTSPLGDCFVMIEGDLYVE